MITLKVWYNLIMLETAVARNYYRIERVPQSADHALLEMIVRSLEQIPGSSDYFRPRLRTRSPAYHFDTHTLSAVEFARTTRSTRPGAPIVDLPPEEWRDELLAGMSFVSGYDSPLQCAVSGITLLGFRHDKLALTLSHPQLSAERQRASDMNEYLGGEPLRGGREHITLGSLCGDYDPAFMEHLEAVAMQGVTLEATNVKPVPSFLIDRKL